MTARETPTPPEWLVPGADVLCFSSVRNHHPVITTVAKVATQSFTVTAEGEPRFRINRCQARTGSDWNASWRRVIPLDSDHARAILASHEGKSRENRARAAVDDWVRKRNRDTRLAAIAALQAIDND